MNYRRDLEHNIDIFEKDIGGQESLRSTWKTYYIDTKVC